MTDRWKPQPFEAPELQDLRLGLLSSIQAHLGSQERLFTPLALEAFPVEVFPERWRKFIAKESIQSLQLGIRAITSERREDVSSEVRYKVEIQAVGAETGSRTEISLFPDRPAPQVIIERTTEGESNGEERLDVTEAEYTFLQEQVNRL